jgi:REP element-mobilizing transposase RayT
VNSFEPGGSGFLFEFCKLKILLKINDTRKFSKGRLLAIIEKKQYPSITNHLWGGSLWSASYFAGSCGGAPISVIRQYIEQQQTPKF